MSTFKDTNQNIMSILGIDKLPKEKQQEAVERLGGIVYQEAMLRVLDTMDDTGKEEFEKYMQENTDPEAVFSYLVTKIPNIDQIFKEEAASLRDEAQEVIGDLKQ